ncbi:MAG: TOBE domain-containing protein, partial [Rhodobacteraceae bacterium]|nr:TOBE domain-containing protein [Paracoccaceae bacterium]
EPLSNLDAELRVQMRQEVARLHRTLGATMVYVTHDQVEAMTLADRIVVLRAGRVEQVGAPLELYENPANAFVAGFIGSPRMNLIPATVRDGAVTLPGLVLPRPGLPAGGTPVQVGLRPEHMVASGPAIAATCEAVERLGAVSYLYARLADGTQVTAQVDAALAVTSPGAAVTLTPDPARALVFAADGARLV